MLRLNRRGQLTSALLGLGTGMGVNLLSNDVGAGDQLAGAGQGRRGR